jgi:hypothetical protein
VASSGGTEIRESTAPEQAERVSAGDALAGPADGERPDDEPRADWIAKDVAVAARVHAAIGLEEPRLSELLAALGIPEQAETRDLGFGARVLRRELHGGYTTHWVTLITHRREGDEAAQPVALRVDARSSRRDSWKHVEGPLREVWSDAPELLHELDFGLRAARTFPEAGRAMDAARARALGETGSWFGPPDGLGAGMVLLLDPFEQLDVGETCYYAGVAPRGREAAAALSAGGHVDLLAIVLRGANPEGRVYAAQELLRLRAAGTALEDAIVETLRTVRALELPISTCSGCIVYDQLAAEILPEVD